MINSISSSGFALTLPTALTSTHLTAAAGEQNPAAESSSVKQTTETAEPNLQQEHEHAKHDSADKQQQQQDLQVISELAARDREVRAHEQAHASVGGAFAGSPSYSMEQGPNGVSYAVGGEVSISTNAISGDPEATMRKADTVRRAALAPASPSAQDRSVAAQATQIKIQAQVELAIQAKDANTADPATSNQVDENTAEESSSSAASDSQESPGLEDFLERNLMTEKALGQDSDFGRTINQLL